MIKSKLLIDSAWKEVLAKNKGIKDNGLMKSLSELKKLSDDDHEGAQKHLDEVIKLVGQLKKAKDVGSAPAVSKFLAEMASVAETAQREVAKNKTEAQKSAKAAGVEDKKHKDGADQEESEEESALLSTKLIPLLKAAKKGERMHAMVATSGKQAVVLLSRKPISPARRKLLADQLGVSGGVKYSVGHCIGEDGGLTFVLTTQATGMAKKLKLALLEQTAMRVNKLNCRGEDGETDADEEEGEDEDPAEADHDGDATADAGEGDAKREAKGDGDFEVNASVGRGGKNLEADVRAVQAALNRRLGISLEVDGRCDADTIEAITNFQRALGQSKPDGHVQPSRSTARALAASGKIGKPPPPPSSKTLPADLGKPALAGAPQVWHGMRSVLDHNIGELKRAINQEYANEHPEVLKEIETNVQRVDVVLEKFDTQLATILDRAYATQDPAERKTEIANAKVALADYVAFVKSEPLIGHIDNNPFGVDTQVKKTISDSLAHMIKSIAQAQR